jgi:plastocyanin
MRTLIAVLCSCLALGLFVTGCGGDDDEGGGEEAATTEETKPAAPAAGAKTTAVTMKDTNFDPQSVTVDKGGTVKWTNEDSVGHDVTKEAGPGPDFKSGSPGGLNQGDTYTHKFTTSGTYGYVCTVHPGMEGSVVVK